MLPYQPVDPIAPPGAARPTDYGSSASKWAPPFERVRVWQGARAAEALKRIEGSGRTWPACVSPRPEVVAEDLNRGGESARTLARSAGKKPPNYEPPYPDAAPAVAATPLSSPCHRTCRGER